MIQPATHLCSQVSATGLDGTYPYGASNPTGTNDTPKISLPVIYGEGAQTFVATMYLMWDPALGNPNCPPAQDAAAGNVQTAITCTSIPIPVGSVQWSWAGCAMNTLV